MYTVNCLFESGYGDCESFRIPERERTMTALFFRLAYPTRLMIIITWILYNSYLYNKQIKTCDLVEDHSFYILQCLLLLWIYSSPESPSRDYVA